MSFPSRQGRMRTFAISRIFFLLILNGLPTARTMLAVDVPLAENLAQKKD